MVAAANLTVAPEPAKPIRLDIGCGPNKKEGFTGMDRRSFPGVDVVHDVTTYPWPFEDGSVGEVHCSHFLEHLDGVERVQFFNELYRVMAKDSKATFVTPHWTSCRAYGDFTHKWPPVSEMLFYYLSKEWRTANAPDNDAEWNPAGYTCNFVVTWGHSMHQELLSRNDQFRQFALLFFKEAAQDTIATLVRN